MEYIAIIWEVLLLAVAVYIYALMRGLIKGKTPAQREKIKELQKDNGWLTYTAMALGAIMIINIVLRFISN